MESVEMNWQRAAKIWWYLFWRAALLSVFVAFAVGAVLGVVLVLLGVSMQGLELAGNILGAAIGAAITIWIITYLPSKKFSAFQVVLQKRHADQESETVSETMS